MIKIGQLITDEIIERHREYILKNNRIIYIDESDKRFKGKIVEQDLLEFKKMLLNEIEFLKKKKSNIFIGKPRVIEEKLKEIKSNHKNILDYIKKESEQKTKNGLIDLINKSLGYNEFSGKILEKTFYSELIRGLKSPSGNIYIEIKAENRRGTGGKYTGKELEGIRNSVESRLEKYSKNRELNNLHEKIIKEIRSVRTEYGVGKFIEAISNIIKKNSNELEIAIREFNIHNMNFYDLYKNSKEWSPYHYVMLMGVEVCPYCNRQYVTPISSNSGKVRADLDHFYPKSKYPFLSMSLYNLVPCCKFCNSSLKGDKEFSYENNLNPFEYGVDEALHFSVIPKAYDLMNGDIEVILEEKKKANKEILKKAKNNIKIFKIEGLYNYHLGDIRKLIRKKTIYSKEIIGDIVKLIKNTGNVDFTIEELENILMDRYDENIINKPLGMLYRDIINELELKIDEEIRLTERELDVIAEYIK